MHQKHECTKNNLIRCLFENHSGPPPARSSNCTWHRNIRKLDDATAANMDNVTMSKAELLALLQQTARDEIASASQVISAFPSTSDSHRQPASQQATTAHTNAPQQIGFGVHATDSSVYKQSSGPEASHGQSNITMQTNPASRPPQTTDQAPRTLDTKMLKALKIKADKSLNARARVCTLTAVVVLLAG